MPAKGDQEILYFGPGQRCAGLDYSLPYNCLDPNSLADGTVNTTQINGFVCSSPWLANNPYAVTPNSSTPWTFATNEFVIGIFELTAIVPQSESFTLIVTNVAVYLGSGPNGMNYPTLRPGSLTVLHTWSVSDISSTFAVPGNAVSFIQVNGTVYFTGIMLNGIFSYNLGGFAQATNYVSGTYIAELAGRLIVAQCRFPGGGGTGTSVLPTVAWSGVGLYSGSGATDPWNPANVNNLGSIGGFNLLSDVPDQITGLAGMGRSAIIFRQQGLTQCDPNPGSANSGLQPFNFYHLWASPQGVGAYAGTVAQFGYMAYFRSSDSVYSINLYNGPTPIGPRIIPKIIQDQKNATYNSGLTSGGAPSQGSWYFASIINVSGQLHYLLQFSAYFNSNPQGFNQTFMAVLYDFNLSENAWHITNLGSYQTSGGGSPGILSFTCPIFQSTELQGYFAITGSNAVPVYAPQFIFVGYISNFGTQASYQQSGSLSQLVYWDYDFNSNPIVNSFMVNLYKPLAIPVTTIVFRGDIISVGHRTSNRRLRVQADNAPMPSFATGSQQQAKAFFTGSLPGNTSSGFLAWTQGAGPGQPTPYMQGNYQPQGAPMQTYYADMVLEDEMIQASIQSYINDASNPWNSLPAFRISSVSLITMDPKSTTQ